MLGWLELAEKPKRKRISEDYIPPIAFTDEAIENVYVENPFTFHDGFDDSTIYASVVSLNLHRRHLTAEQKRELIAKLLKAKPEQSNRTIAKQVKADHKTVAASRLKLESTGELPSWRKRSALTAGRANSRLRK